MKKIIKEIGYFIIFVITSTVTIGMMYYVFREVFPSKLSLAENERIVVIEKAVISLEGRVDTLELKLAQKDTIIKFLTDSLNLEKDSRLNYLLGFNEVFGEEYPWVVRRVKAKMLGVDPEYKFIK